MDVRQRTGLLALNLPCSSSSILRSCSAWRRISVCGVPISQRRGPAAGKAGESHVKVGAQAVKDLAEVAEEARLQLAEVHVDLRSARISAHGCSRRQRNALRLRLMHT